MGRRALAFLERLLVAAVSLLLALMIAGAFVRALRGPELVAASPGEGVRATSTTDRAVTFPETECAEDLPEPNDGATVLRVFYSCGAEALPTAEAFVHRVVPQTESLLAATMAQLVKGPSNTERDLGFRSVFSVATTEALASATVRAGEAVIDFRALPDVTASSAAESVEFFVANLNANVLQFDSIQSVEYRLEGSCAAFWERLGDDTGCRVIARENFESEMAGNRDA